jgi:histidine triad (HIT) family protein
VLSYPALLCGSASGHRSGFGTSAGECKTAAVFNHEPADYRCPFCAFLREEWDDHNAPTDLVAQEELSYARIAPKWWPENPGSVLVIPTGHDENVYDTPSEVGHDVWDLTRRVAVAMRETFGCEGISTRQHNEPAGDQDVWHMHVHVFARKPGDQLYGRHGEASFVPPQERAPWADRLRGRLSNVTVYR